jgi:hypothetical protein
MISARKQLLRRDAQRRTTPQLFTMIGMWRAFLWQDRLKGGEFEPQIVSEIAILNAEVTRRSWMISTLEEREDA